MLTNTGLISNYVNNNNVYIYFVTSHCHIEQWWVKFNFSLCSKVVPRKSRIHLWLCFSISLFLYHRHGKTSEQSILLPNVCFLDGYLLSGWEGLKIAPGDFPENAHGGRKKTPLEARSVKIWNLQIASNLIPLERAWKTDQFLYKNHILKMYRFHLMRPWTLSEKLLKTTNQITSE